MLAEGSLSIAGIPLGVLGAKAAAHPRRARGRINHHKQANSHIIANKPQASMAPFIEAFFVITLTIILTILVILHRQVEREQSIRNIIPIGLGELKDGSRFGAGTVGNKYARVDSGFPSYSIDLRAYS